MEGGDFLECWKWLSKKYSDEVEADKLMRWVAYGLWRHWKCRNKVVFEKSIVGPRSALESLFRQWSELEGEGEEQRLATRPHRGVGGMVQERWVKPPFQTIKVNCDGACCSQTGIGGVGWVARDFAGIFQGGGGVGGVLCGSSLMAEAEAVRWGLLACMERGYGRVHVETDSKMLVEMLNVLLLSEASIEGVLWDIEYGKNQLDCVEFLYTPRACNEVSYLVAKFVKRMGGSHLWDYLEPE